MKKNHWLWMVLGCGLPLLFIFFAPALGITGYNGLFTFIILMFAFHLFMPHGTHGHGKHKDNNSSNKGHHHNQKSNDDSSEKRKERRHH